MDTRKLFDSTISLLEKSLDLRSRNHRVITSNIANSDTPDYKAVHMDVEKNLATESRSSQPEAVPVRQPGHIPLRPRTVRPRPIRRTMAGSLQLRGDGNTVDMDRSMANLAKNSLLYNTSAQIIRRKFEGLRAVIQDGSGGK